MQRAAHNLQGDRIEFFGHIKPPLAARDADIAMPQNGGEISGRHNGGGVVLGDDRRACNGVVGQQLFPVITWGRGG